AARRPARRPRRPDWRCHWAAPPSPAPTRDGLPAGPALVPALRWQRVHLAGLRTGASHPADVELAPPACVVFLVTGTRLRGHPERRDGVVRRGGPLFPLRDTDHPDEGLGQETEWSTSAIWL